MFFLKEKDDKKKFYLNLTSKKITYIKWIDEFIIDFYRSLGISYLDIYYMNDNKFYLNIYKFIYWNQIDENKYITDLNYNALINIKTENNINDILKNKPDVLIIYHKDLNSSLKNYEKPFLFSSKTKDIYKKFESNYEELNKFKDIQEEIEFNGDIYILDSILLNYDNKTIVGFKHDDEKYIYNNFSLNEENPCSIIKFDWKFDEGEFCYNPFKCDLDENLDKIENLCFDFKTGNKTLIYIKKDINKKKINEIPDIPDSEILQIIKTIKKLEITDLITFIKNYEPSIIGNSSNRDELEKKYLRFFLINYLNFKKDVEEKLPE